ALWTQTMSSLFSDHTWLKKFAGADWHLENRESHDHAYFSVGRSNAEARTEERPFLHDRAGSPQSGWDRLDWSEQKGHWHSRYGQPRYDWPLGQPRMHPPGKLGRSPSR